MKSPIGYPFVPTDQVSSRSGHCCGSQHYRVQCHDGHFENCRLSVLKRNRIQDMEIGQEFQVGGCGCHLVFSINVKMYSFTYRGTYICTIFLANPITLKNKQDITTTILDFRRRRKYRKISLDRTWRPYSRWANLKKNKRLGILNSSINCEVYRYAPTGIKFVTDGRTDIDREIANCLLVKDSKYVNKIYKQHRSIHLNNVIVYSLINYKMYLFCQ